MSIQPDQFLEYVQIRAGEALRAVMLFTADEYRHLYLRDDIAEMYPEEQYQQISALFSEEADHLSQSQLQFQVGEFESFTLIFEDAIILVFPTKGGKGGAVSLDREAGSRLFTFVHEARKRLYGTNE